MKTLSQIIQEETTKYIQNIIQEKYKGKEESQNSQRRDGNNIARSDELNIRQRIVGDDENLVNVAALARKIYPDHTPEGAQSQLRKKLKGAKNDNGSEYHIKERELGMINRELRDI